jgi:arylsulfatase A-like enzyme
MASRRPNVVFVFADQLRRQATGFGGETNIQTPHLDRLASQSIDFVNAISGSPVCCPARASLLTGQYPHHHGVIINDVPLDPDAQTMGKLFAEAGYDTAYIGKWHVNANGRCSPIPVERQHGFEYWKVLECTHNYNNSLYYEGAGVELKKWDGYDAIAQTNDAIGYIKSHKRERPFLLTLSWGPPHDPYDSAPERFRSRIDEEQIVLRDNVPEEKAAEARAILKGYYAHMLALDECIGFLMTSLDEAGVADDTILVFWSDHGDMLLSQGESMKQRPWDESIRVPFLVRYPERFGYSGKKAESFINTPDILPTLLGLCGIEVPSTVDGSDNSAYMHALAAADSVDDVEPLETSAILACQSPFGQFTREVGGREYRGLRTKQYTYVKSLDGPWLLYNNLDDPFQLRNLISDPGYAPVLERLDHELGIMLEETDDALVPGHELLEKFGYAENVDETGTMHFSDDFRRT